MEDHIQILLKKLLATEDAEEFDTLSRELKGALHERIEKLRNEAQALKSRGSEGDRKKRPRNGKNKP